MTSEERGRPPGRGHLPGRSLPVLAGAGAVTLAMLGSCAVDTPASGARPPLTSPTGASSPNASPPPGAPSPQALPPEPLPTNTPLTDVLPNGGGSKGGTSATGQAWSAAGPPATAARVPWEGGPAYYGRFAAPAAAGWTSPSFFPVGVWFESVITQGDVNKDKAAGINTYVELTTTTNMELVRKNGMSALTNVPLPGYGKETVGWLLDDEVDMWAKAGDAPWTGKHPGEGALCIPENKGCGFTVLRTQKNRFPRGDGRMHYANYGKGVMMWERDVDAATFVNYFTDVVSTDVYWYTSESACLDGKNFLSLSPARCRRAANYGTVIDRQRELDALDGRLQPIYAFVEVGWPAENDTRAIEPYQVTGAVMSSLIHEARGIIYFNHNFGGPCHSQHVLREKCGERVRPAVTEINRRIAKLAPVLNTQSYRHRFGPGLDTMLKHHRGSSYVFAMPRAASTPGRRTFTLPRGVRASRAEVLFENRSVPIDRRGRFTDSFAAEHSHHIYRITTP
ncbi:hypothetical protein ACLQ2R_00980 [Streptosporangium sp. DT93]|uniref:hypothetical protein n=1 Tax=Streptosporangium sp. DT93 TaxID=3393428 RepID=UPI003CECCCE7